MGFAASAAVAPAPLNGPAAAIVASIVITGSKVVLSWEANPAKTYQVFYKDSIADADWTAVDGEVLLKWWVVNEQVVTDSVSASHWPSQGPAVRPRTALPVFPPTGRTPRH